MAFNTKKSDAFNQAGKTLSRLRIRAMDTQLWCGSFYSLSM